MGGKSQCITARTGGRRGGDGGVAGEGRKTKVDAEIREEIYTGKIEISRGVRERQGCVCV